MSASKVVLITGTSSGIGLATAVAAARSGWHTVATLRDTSRADALRAAASEAGVADKIQIRQLDATDPTSVAACVDGVLAEHGRLDAVINNAGAGHVGTIEQESIADVRDVMELNFFGVVQVTRAALPHLRASTGRLVTVTSVGGVAVTVIEPGAVASEFVTNVGVDPVRLVAAAGPYAPALRAYIARVTGQFAGAAQTPAQAAEPIIRVLSADRPAFRIQTSDSAREFTALKLA